MMRSEFLLTNLNALATSGTSSLVRIEHFSANFVLEFPILDATVVVLFSQSGKAKNKLTPLRCEVGGRVNE